MSPKTSNKLGVCRAASSLEPQSLHQLHQYIVKTWGANNPPDTVAKTQRQHRTVEDGMWARPGGYPPFEDDPELLHVSIDVSKSQHPSMFQAQSSSVCKSKTKTGERCRHKVRHGSQRCAAGHKQ